MEHWSAIAEERRHLADELGGLDDARWATPSLCGTWTVHQVLGHLVVPLVTPMPALIVEMVKARGNFDRANDAMARKQARRSPGELMGVLRSRADSRFHPPGYGSEAPLTDVLVHGEDIRVPLGLTTDADPARWIPALEFLITPKAAKDFRTGGFPTVQLVATDAPWHGGSGPELRGLAADLGLALTGRQARLDRLSGPGADLLR
jgi:uncharacterized protein (TIGR03083 family)